MDSILSGKVRRLHRENLQQPYLASSSQDATVEGLIYTMDGTPPSQFPARQPRPVKTITSTNSIVLNIQFYLLFPEVGIREWGRGGGVGMEGWSGRCGKGAGDRERKESEPGGGDTPANAFVGLAYFHA